MIVAGVFAFVLGVQLLGCRFIKNKFLRHPGLAVCAVLLGTSAVCFCADPGFVYGGNILMGGAYLLFTVGGFAGYVAAWLIHRFIRRRKMNISMIAAVGRNLELGKNNALLWRLEGDLPFFKRVTMGKTVIMGRKTYESMGRALPGRRNVVITRDKTFSAPDIEIAPSPMAALDQCAGDEEVFVIGGGQIYAAFLPMAKKLYLTEAEAEDPEADTYFPVFDKEKWERAVLDEGGGEIRYTHVLYERKKSKK